MTDEHIEVALSWARGEITMAQIQEAGIPSGVGAVAVYIFLSQALRDYILKLEKK